MLLNCEPADRARAGDELGEEPVEEHPLGRHLLRHGAAPRARTSLASPSLASSPRRAVFESCARPLSQHRVLAVQLRDCMRVRLQRPSELRVELLQLRGLLEFAIQPGRDSA